MVAGRGPVREPWMRTAFSRGPEPNLLAKIRIHWTSNANGEGTAQFETVECKVVGGKE